MTVADALRGVQRLFVDTAPIIYLVEGNPAFSDAVARIFAYVDSGDLTAVTSPITLAECLVAPYRLGLAPLVTDFVEVVVGGANTEFVPIGAAAAESAARLRAAHGLTLTDALQVATAQAAACDAFLTNDADLRRITSLRVIVVSDLT